MSPARTDFDREAWAAAADSFFEATERQARILHACRTLAALVPDHNALVAHMARAVAT